VNAGVATPSLSVATSDRQCIILIDDGAAPGEANGLHPKALRAAAGDPFLEILLGEARRRGFSDFLLLAGRRAEAAAAFVVERQIEKRFDCTVEVSTEPAPDGTLVSVPPRLKDDFLLLNGAVWFDFNWLDLFSWARGEGAAAALALREDVADELALDDGFVRSAPLDDPKRAVARAGGGVCYLTRRAVEEAASPWSSVDGILPRLAAGGALRGRRYSGSFIDLDTTADLGAVGRLVASRRRRPAVFLDRDGVLNIDRGYVHASHQLEWVEGAREAVKFLNDAGYYVFVVTNQAGVAKGLYPEEAIARLHGWMAEELAAAGASIDDWRYCAFHPDGSVAAYRKAHPWRKPSPGMLLDLFDHWPIAREGSFLVGDKATDIAAAEAAGVEGFLFEGGNLKAFLQERGRLAVVAAADHG
jgi:D,D-heptose 1,7-bisphosphate phosphatase